MKEIKNLEIQKSSTSADLYNSLPGKSSSYEEAKRTIEAIERVREHLLLVSQIKKEVGDYAKLQTKKP